MHLQKSRLEEKVSARDKGVSESSAAEGRQEHREGSVNERGSWIRPHRSVRGGVWQVMSL